LWKKIIFFPQETRWRLKTACISSLHWLACHNLRSSNPAPTQMLFTAPTERRLAQMAAIKFVKDRFTKTCCRHSHVQQKFINNARLPTVSL